MNSDEIKRLEDLLKITDGLLRRSIYERSWIGALLERLVASEAGRTGKSADEIRSDLRSRRKEFHQRLMEKLESRDPGFAAEIDDRSIEDIL